MESKIGGWKISQRGTLITYYSLEIKARSTLQLRRLKEIEEKPWGEKHWLFLFHVTKRDGKPGQINISVKKTDVDEFRKDLDERIAKAGFEIKDTY